MGSKKDRNRRLPRTQPNGQVTGFSVQASYSGPLPPPSDLQQYDAIVPGMAERVLIVMEKQADHRMALENHVINADVRRANGGLVAAAVFGLAILGAGVYLIVNGYEGAGTTFIIAELSTYGLAFLYSSETRRRERNKKNR